MRRAARILAKRAARILMRLAVLTSAPFVITTALIAGVVLLPAMAAAYVAGGRRAADRCADVILMLGVGWVVRLAEAADPYYDPF